MTSLKTKPKRVQAQRRVQLTRRQHLLYLQPMPVEVRRWLTSNERLLEYGTEEFSELIGVLDDDDGMTLVGLEPVVRHLLRQAGYRLTRAERERRLPEPDLAAVQEHGVVDKAILDVVAHHDHALVRYGPGVDRVWLIAQLALAFPDLTIMVFCSRNHEVHVLARRLSQWLPNEVTEVENGCIPEEKKRIMVRTYQQMPESSDIRERDLLIALDAIETLGQHGILTVNETYKAKLLGFLPRDAVLASRDTEHLHGYFGFQEVDVPAQGYKPLTVKVVFEKHKGPLNVENPEDQLSLRRNGVWHDPDWNRRIARVAKALQENDRVRLRSFPGVLKASQRRKMTRVAVLVENVEQALSLAEYLPGWPLNAGQKIDVKGLPRKARDLLKSRPKASANPNYGIFTLETASQLDPGQFDVLIRADAGTGLPGLDEAKLVIPSDSQHNLLLLDFEDRRHDELRRWTEKRREAYRARGWYGVGVDPVEERVKLLLKSRNVVYGDERLRC
jgi:hypothetical protein